MMNAVGKPENNKQIQLRLHKSITPAKLLEQ